MNTQAETRIQQLEALRTVDMAISGSFDLNLTLGVLLDQVLGQLGVHAADILIYNAAAQTFKFGSERGFRLQTLRHVQVKYGTGFIWRVVRERQVVDVPDITAGPDGLQRSPDLSSERFVTYLGLPLVAKGQIGESSRSSTVNRSGSNLRIIISWVSWPDRRPLPSIMPSYSRACKVQIPS